MKVQVRFRFNKETGEVEDFLIDDQASQLPEAEHNREHDRIATDIGRVVERHPRIQEIHPGSSIATPLTNQVPEQPETSTDSTPRERQKQ
jgi:hypothetical protein